MNALVLDVLLAADRSPSLALAGKATLALLAAFIFMRAARRASAAWRHLVAAATFGILLLLPLASLLVPAQVIALETPASAPAAAPAARALPGAAPVVAPAPLPGPAAAPARGPDVTLSSVLLALYLAGAAALMLALAAGIVRLQGVRARADVSVPGTRLVNEAAREQGLPGGIEVAITGELAVPVTFGWTRPVVLLPAETAGWSEAEMGRALRHELEHVARGDWATQVMARLAVAFYWPHPLSWMLWSRLRLEAERACDDAVVRSLGQPETYAEQLVTLARRLRGRGAVPALSMATRSNLGLRVDSILAAGLRRGPRSRLATTAVSLAAAAGLLALAPVRVVGAVPAEAEEPLALASAGQREEPLDEALLKVAEAGDVAAMRSLLDRGARADAVIEGDGSPLIAAARAGQVEAIDVLVAAGASVNRGVGGDGNALTNAARAGHLEAVRFLLDKGASIDAGVPGDGNALIMAAGAGQVEVVRFLLDRGAGLEVVVPGDENALIHASEAGQAEVVRFLLDRGANVNARVWAERRGGAGGEWRTALSMAVRNRHREVVALLRAAGARE
jgi:beta-lactamase regulating signal transducer with metallopeptidase domain